MEPESDQKRRRRSPGRIIVLTAYWALMTYAFGSIYGSMLHTFHTKPDIGAPPQQQRRWCLSQLAGLKADLEQRVLEEVEGSFRAHSTLTRKAGWEAAWNEALEDATNRCNSDPNVAEAYTELALLKVSYVLGMRGLADNGAKQGRELDRKLRAMGGG